MDKLTFWLGIFTQLCGLLIAIVTIIPSIRSNRKETQKSIDALKKTLDDHIKEDEDEKARAQRYRILRFYDEMCEGKNHSESHFEDVLDDIDNYERYCSTHPNFRNSRGTAAMEYIKETYHKVKSKGGFLTHQEGEIA